MPISRSLFDLIGNLPNDPVEAANKLNRSLVETVSVEGANSPEWLGELWLALSEYHRQDISSEEFMRRIESLLT